MSSSSAEAMSCARRKLSGSVSTPPSPPRPPLRLVAATAADSEPAPAPGGTTASTSAEAAADALIAAAINVDVFDAGTSTPVFTASAILITEPLTLTVRPLVPDPGTVTAT